MTPAAPDLVTLWEREVATQLAPLCFDVTGQDGAEIYRAARGGGPTLGDLRAIDAEESRHWPRPRNALWNWKRAPWRRWRRPCAAPSPTTRRPERGADMNGETRCTISNS